MASPPAVGVASPPVGESVTGDPTRLRVAAALAEGGEMCVCDMAWVVEQADQLVSHHLRLLRSAGLAASRRQGKLVLYSLTRGPLPAAAGRGFAWAAVRGLRHLRIGVGTLDGVIRWGGTSLDLSAITGESVPVEAGHAASCVGPFDVRSGGRTPRRRAERAVM